MLVSGLVKVMVSMLKFFNLIQISVQIIYIMFNIYQLSEIELNLKYSFFMELFDVVAIMLEG